jgi:heme-degrading monooxygenase HmoA/predicted ester cyclase
VARLERIAADGRTDRGCGRTAGRGCLTAGKGGQETIMHVRMNMLVGDPARLDEATRYLEGSVRPHVEAQPGNRGIAVLTNADLGVCVIASYWDTADAMAASEQAVEVPRKELTELVSGTVTVEHYEAAVFVRRSWPPAGAGVRMTRIDGDPAQMNAAIAEFRKTGVPALMQMPGLCSTQFLVDRETGHSIAVTAWQDHEAMAAGRSVVATLRADLTAVTHTRVRMVEEFTLMFSSVRQGDTRSLIERDIELWNNRDREGWMGLADLHRLELHAPGGMELSGRDAADTIWTMWHEAFPDNRLEIVTLHADDRGGVHEGRFVGTHTGILRTPAGEIAPTGRILDARFCGVYEIDNGKITSTHLYFDQADLLAQLGPAPG